MQSLALCKIESISTREREVVGCHKAISVQLYFQPSGKNFKVSLRQMNIKLLVQNIYLVK